MIFLAAAPIDQALVAALGIGSGISKSEVSRICAGLDEQVEAFRSRPLHHTAFRLRATRIFRGSVR